jgi:hypothetical protein
MARGLPQTANGMSCIATGPCATVGPWLSRPLSIRPRRVLLCCDRGDDRAPAVALAVLLAFFEIDAISRRLEGPRAPLDKEDLRARMALLQGAYPDARVPRLFHKELNNFFVAPAGGWRALGRRSRRAARGDVAIE